MANQIEPASLTRDEALQQTQNLNVRVHDLITEYQRRQNRIEIAILAISVFTSGGLWILIAKSAQVEASWCGAALSTIMTGLISYQKSTIGPKSSLKKAIEIQSKIDKIIIDLITNKKYNSKEHMRNFKSAAGEAYRLEKFKGRDYKSLSPSEQQAWQQSHGQ